MQATRENIDKLKAKLAITKPGLKYQVIQQSIERMLEELKTKKKSVIIKRKPLADIIYNSFIDNIPLDLRTRGSLFNPVKKTFIKNTIKNRISVNKQIDEYNENLKNKLLAHQFKSSSGLNGFFEKHTIENNKNVLRYDLIEDGDFRIKKTIKMLLEKELKKRTGGYKVYFTFTPEFIKVKAQLPSAGRDIADKYISNVLKNNIKYVPSNIDIAELFDIDTQYISNKAVIVLNTHNINESIDSLFNTIIDKTDNSIEKSKGSGWIFHLIKSISVNITKNEISKPKSYIPTPKFLADKKAIVNIQNEDEQCFKWSIIGALYTPSSNPQRVSQYKKYENLFDWTGIDFPVSFENIDTFEENNPDISINVYNYIEDSNMIKPVRFTMKPKQKHINLLVIEDNEKQHYTIIRNYSRLMSSQLTNHKGEIYPCYFCNKACTSEQILKRHVEKCAIITEKAESVLTMPEEGDNELQFKNYNNKFKAPFSLVADFEAILEKAENTQSTKSMKLVNIHRPCSFGINMITDFEKYKLPHTIYTGKNEEDTMENFFKALDKYEKHIFDILKTVKPMKPLTKIQNEEYKNTKNCHICEREITTEQVKVRDHCHITGDYRGPAHQDCNVNFNYKNYKIPVIIHNLKNYDSHFIIKHSKNPYAKISVIANNSEKFMSFNIGRLKFIDSFQFLSSSLDKLVENLKKDSLEDFKYTKANMGEHWKLACEKGVYPYEYMDSFDKFNDQQLPPIEAFYSNLNECKLKQDDYNKAINVWNTLGIKTMNEYHDFYLKCDIFLLSDVVEAFRNAIIKTHQLDPFHYISLPGFSWDCALKTSKIKLELLTDYTMLEMVENGIRGGISMISHRYSQANNKYMTDYNENEPSKYITYQDANNLYGLAMSMSLPYKNFQWIDANTYNISEINNKPEILRNDNKNIGHIYEVDLTYPEELHESHNDYPLAPESITVNNDMLSDWCSKQQKILGLTENRTSKLVPNLNNKTKYVLHEENLIYYLQKGLKLTSIHRVIEFAQMPWLKTYIDKNTKLRKECKNDFEKDLYKLLNNSVFGKTMENVRSRIDYEIVNNLKRARSITQSNRFKSFSIINNNLVGVQSIKTNVVFNKPIYCGLTVLDLSKLHMFKFHYDVMKPKYKENIRLLATDTDSLIYEINTDDFYSDMKDINEHFDFSEYPKEHFMFDETNKKAIGKFKDETNSVPITKFIGLAPKMYSIVLENGKEKGTAKGIKKSFYKNHISHSNYNTCITGKTSYDTPTLEEYKANCRQTATFQNFRSVSHQICTYVFTKFSLTNYDNKRYLLEDGITSYAYGHKNIKNI